MLLLAVMSMAAPGWLVPRECLTLAGLNPWQLRIISLTRAKQAFIHHQHRTPIRQSFAVHRTAPSACKGGPCAACTRRYKYFASFGTRPGLPADELTGVEQRDGEAC